MNILDIIIILGFTPIIISGYKKGFINQAISIIALVVGMWTAVGCADEVGTWFLPMMETGCDNPEGISYLAGFATTLVMVMIPFLIIGIVIKKIAKIMVPDTIDKVLGVILAATNGYILFCILYILFVIMNNLFMFSDIKGAFFSDSLFCHAIESTANLFIPQQVNMLI